MTHPANVPPAGDAPRPRVRWRRHLFFFLASLLALPLVLVFVGLGALDSPLLKTRLRRALREGVGIDLQYGRLQVRPFSGVHLDDLRLFTPPPYDTAEPVLLRVGAIDVGWSLRRLLFGAGPLLDEVSIRDVALTLVGGAAVMLAWVVVRLWWSGRSSLQHRATRPAGMSDLR